MEGFQSAEVLTRRSERVLSSKAIQWVALGVVLLVALASIASLIRTIWAKSQLGGSDSRYVIVSSRPKTEDVKLILASDEKDIKYLRSDDSFAQVLLKGASAGKSDLRVFEFGATALKGEVPQERVETYLDQRKAGDTLPLIPLAVMVGITLGFLVPLAGNWLGPWMFGVAGVAFVKLATDCSTCPQATIFGIDAALLGGGLFALTGLSFLALPGAAPRSITAAVLASATLWQVLSAWNLKEFCLPCTTVALASSWAATSALTGRESQNSAPSLLSRTLPWLAAVSIAFLVYLAAAPPEVPEAQARTTSLGMPKHIKIGNLKELGLPAFGHPVALYVGHDGCHPCMEGLAAIDAIDLKGLTFVYTGDTPPDTKREWTRLPNDKLIGITPSVIFADAKGNVVGQEFGFATSTEYLEGFSKKLAGFKVGSVR